MRLLRRLAMYLLAAVAVAATGASTGRRGSCAPRGAWTERDEEAAQAPGIQQAYGTRPGFVRPRDEVLPMTYGDHDALLVRAKLRG